MISDDQPICIGWCFAWSCYQCFRQDRHVEVYLDCNPQIRTDRILGHIMDNGHTAIYPFNIPYPSTQLPIVTMFVAEKMSEKMFKLHEENKLKGG